jgi:tetratricopeptide (TPR) repeat protein
VIAEASDFNTALNFYSGINPLNTADYSNLLSSYGWLQVLTYYNSLNFGIGFKALNKGNSVVAKASADKAAEVIDEAVIYYISQNAVTAQAANLITNNTYTLSDRYSAYGYLRVAELYIGLGENAEAKQTLDKAMAYVDQMTESFHRSKAYAAIGHFYDLAGYHTEAAAAFAAAAGFDHTRIDTDTNRVNHFLGLAYDAINRQGGSDVALAGTRLSLASTYAGLIGTANDTASRAGVAAFRRIAEQYYILGDMNNVIASLEGAETSASGVASPANRLTDRKDIYTDYAKYGFLNAAVSKVVPALIPEEADRNATIQLIAEAVATADYFPDSTIAFSDLDKDGKPDFFVPWATDEQILASGLELDDDTDGDGTLDDEDLAPFFAD